MPGIAGFIGRMRPGEMEPMVRTMLGTMRHEPFYETGLCCASELGACAGWLAHPGSFAALESGRSGDATLELAFAGECFPEGCTSGPPQPADRKDGRSCGSLFDLYTHAGDKWVAGLNGLFSGLLIDRRRARVMLFNDRYGAERLYVHETEHGTYFASEAKALLRVLPSLRSFDDEGVAQFLKFGCPLDGRTLFHGIRLLEGGSLWSFDGSSCRKQGYFTPADWERQPALSVQDFHSEFQSTFSKALPHYFRGEDRVGLSLTGGLDTRMIMACLPSSQTPPICYTFAGLRGETLDARVAARVAGACGLEHQLLRIGPDFLSDYPRFLDRTVYITDGSAGATGAHEIYLNRKATGLAPSRLTGNFGGEVLRGVSTFRPLHLARELLAPQVRVQVDALAENAQAKDVSPVTFAAFREVPWSLFGTMAAARSQLVLRTPYLDNALVALAYRTPASVRESPYAALRLVQDARPALSAIATDRGVLVGGGGFGYAFSRFWAELTFKLDYLHHEGLPSSLKALAGPLGALDQAGFLGPHRYLPYRLWFQRDLSRYVADVLGDSTTSRSSFWNGQALPALVRDHLSGRRSAVREINAVLTLEAVDRLLIRGEGWKK